jgi:general secretion pathway protein D
MNWKRAAIFVVVAAALAGCASGRAYRRGQEAARINDWDTAVAYYNQALSEDPDRLEVRVALERARQSAALEHLSLARKFEGEGQFAAAASEYRRVLDLDAKSQMAAAKAAEMDRKLREQIDAARPKPEIERLREEIRKEQEASTLGLQIELPAIRFNGTLRELLDWIAAGAGVNILIDPAMLSSGQELNKAVELNLQKTTVEGVLRHLSLMHKLFYRALDPRTILVAKDDVGARQQYEEQLIQTFYLSHSKAVDVANILTQTLRPQGAGGSSVPPVIIHHEGNNTLTVRATDQLLKIAERIVHINDRPKAEVVIEVSILEVDRARAKQHGLDLSQYAAGITLSPELAPPNTATTPDAFPAQPPPINANTISRGISTNDLYLTVPSAMIRFLESDANTRLIAKPNLRGQDGAKLTLNLGDEIPIPTTTFGSAAGGGLATIPISQFTYRPVGVNMVVTPKVTYEGEVILDILVESSGQGPNVNVAGQALPAFTSRKVQSIMRLRDGESNMIAGLLREDERRSLRGFPGLLRVPVLRDLFTANDHRIETSDIVMLLTPRIVRTQEITAEDLRPINVGTSQNIGMPGSGALFGAPASIGVGTAPAPSGASIPGAAAPGVPTQPIAAAPGAPPGPPIPPSGAANRPVQDLPVPAQPPAGPPAAQPQAGASGALVTVTTPDMTAGTPVSVPLTISNASRVTQLMVSISYDPKVLRARAVSQGGFMGQGGQPVTFLPRIDEAAGVVTVVMSRTGDTTGASGSGLLASVQFDTIAPGSGTLALSGSATSPDGVTLPIQFLPVPFRIR